jgi:hypothetical protein
MLKEVSEYLRKVYEQDVNMLMEFLHSLPDSNYMLEWKKRLLSWFGDDEDIVKLDEWDWSFEEIFRASFAVMALRTWSDFDEEDEEMCEVLEIKEVKLSEILKLYYVWYTQDCKVAITPKDSELYTKYEKDFVSVLRDTYYKVQKTFWEQETFLRGGLVFGDSPAGADRWHMWKRVIAASDLPRLVLEKEVLIMPYKLVRDV